MLSEPKNARIPELDGLRGIAILLVIFWHYGYYQIVDSGFLISTLSKDILSIFWSGVDLFFVLSGYLIGGILLKYKGSRNYFKTFYIRRILRIFPLYFVIVGLFVIFYFSIPGIDQKIPDLFFNPIPIWSYFLFCQNFLMVSQSSAGAGWLAVTWSLAIEEQFYLLFPFLIYTVKKKYLFIPLAILIILAPVFRYYSSGDYFKMHMLPQCRMDTLLTGVLIAYLFEIKKVTKFLETKRIYFYILPLPLLSGIYFYSIVYHFINPAFIYSLFNILYGTLVIIPILYKDSLFSKVLRNGLLRKIGVVSYGIYLFHLIIYNLLTSILGKYEIGINNNYEVLLAGIVSFVFTFIISLISYYFFESKFIKAGHNYKF